MLKLGALVCATVAAIYGAAPVQWGLKAEYHFDAKSQLPLQLDPIAPAVHPKASFELMYRLGSKGYPLVVSPADAAQWTLAGLLAFARTNEAWINARLLAHGVVLFRGFHHAVQTPADFEKFSLALAPHLENVYLGTSPRHLWPGLRFVHTASEFPSWRVIPPHCEMSFRRTPPTRILFFALQPPTRAQQYGRERRGGETPLIDFEAVARDLSETAAGRRFRDRDVRYIRHYYDDSAPWWSLAHRFDPLKTKSWQVMFNATEWGVAHRAALEQSFTPTWTVSGEGAGTYRLLKLVHTMPALRVHPATGTDIWHNHHSVLYAGATADECAFSAQWLDSWFFVAQHWWFSALLGAQRAINALGGCGGDGGCGDEHLGQQTTHGDGTAIAAEDVAAVRAAVWKHTLAYPHERGDVALLDNMRIGHARQPFRGPRRILTTWA
jgi:alpha-ketoglutarate-dependent taurine dioxygenase